MDVSQRGTEVTAAVQGELDLATVPELESSLALAPVPPGGRLVLDLRDLVFIDSSAIRLLMTLDIRARSEGWELFIVRGAEAVRQVFDLCRLGERIRLVDDPADIGQPPALEGTPHPSVPNPSTGS